jgi:hypothetical protein
MMRDPSPKIQKGYLSTDPSVLTHEQLCPTEAVADEKRQLSALMRKLTTIVEDLGRENPVCLSAIRDFYVKDKPIETEAQWKLMDEFEGTLRERLNLAYTSEQYEDEWRRVQTLLEQPIFRTVVFGIKQEETLSE